MHWTLGATRVEAWLADRMTQRHGRRDMNAPSRANRIRSADSTSPACAQDFPILSTRVNGKPLVYLDNAASAQKPEAVIEAMTRMMQTSYANVHRGLHALSTTATEAYETAREKVRAFINAPHADQVIFTSGGTDAINLVANSLGASINAGDEIVLSQMEHHSNIVPWHFLRERKGAVIRWAPIKDDGVVRSQARSKRCCRRARNWSRSPICRTCSAP